MSTPAAALAEARALYKRVHGHDHQWDAITRATEDHTDPTRAANAIAEAAPSRSDIVCNTPWSRALYVLDHAAGMTYSEHVKANKERYWQHRARTLGEGQ